MERKRRPCIDRKKEIFAVGDEAYEMYEKAPSTIEVVFPMKDGVISRFTDMQFLLQSLLKKGPAVCTGIRIRYRRTYRCNRSRKESLF